MTLPGRHSVTDSGLAFLSRLALLTGLDLTDYTQVTDQGVRQLSCMARSVIYPLLSTFNCSGKSQQVSLCSRLKTLSLSNTQVTDAGLPSLRAMLDLQELCLDRTAVTSRGVAQLIQHLPQLQVMSSAGGRRGGET